MEMRRLKAICGVAAGMLAGALAVLPVAAQQNQAPPPDPNVGVRLEVMEGSKAFYRVREQLAGISFPNDAVGTTENVSGQLVILPGGGIDASQSKLTVDLRTLKSDQDQRDGYMRSARGLNTEQFPFAEFVPKRVEGLPWPFPSTPPAQAGFILRGDMTIYGNTREIAWNVVATFNPKQVSGRATTEFTFADFGIPKPQLARLLSVDDTIRLEAELRFSRTPLTQ